MHAEIQTTEIDLLALAVREYGPKLEGHRIEMRKLQNDTFDFQICDERAEDGD